MVRHLVNSVFLTLSIAVACVVYGVAHEKEMVSNMDGMMEGHVNAAQRLVKKELEMVRIDEKVGEILDADLTFYDQNGQPVNLGDYITEKPLVLSFAYYSCSLICQFVLQGQVEVFNQLVKEGMFLGEDFDAVTISFDFNDDAELTTQMVKTYAEKTARGVSQPEWVFLYGEEKEINSVTEQLGFHYDFIEASGEFAHSAAIYVITPTGRISRYFYGIQYDPFDLKLALIEAKGEKSQTTVERILMYCYQYDADSRGYALEAMRVMQAGGLATVVLLGLFLALANGGRIRLIRKR